MFEASRPFSFLDYFRIPYRLRDALGKGLGDGSPFGRLQWQRDGEGAPAFYWADAQADFPESGLLPPCEHRMDGVPIYGHLVADPLARSFLDRLGGDWKRTSRITDAAGKHSGSVWTAADGSLFVPFDPTETVRNFWSEQYRAFIQGEMSVAARRLITRLYYRVRPAVPRATQISLRRFLTRLQAQSRFPRWPIETALHDLYDILLGHLAFIAGQPLPWISLWPNGHSWALVLTHDVETSVGYQNLHVLRNVELEAGYRSSWYFVPKRYEVADELVKQMVGDGFEVGLHGLYHDGRDLESLGLLLKRLPAIRHYARQWGSVGFRSPATQRVWQWMPLLGFDYDSSSPDTDPFEPQPGGCCTWLPFFNQGIVELPITLPQDHTLFVLLRETTDRVWAQKAEHLRRANGMALLLTHPDYMSDGRSLQAYKSFLERYRDDPTAWRALPREVSAWWRRRAESSLEWTPGGWRIVGPAAVDGSVAFVRPHGK